MWFTKPGSAAPPPSPTEARELVLYKYDACGFCQRVLRAIRQLDLEITTRDTLLEPEARQALMDATGRTQVPCLFIDGHPLFESADIVVWLQTYAKHQAELRTE